MGDRFSRAQKTAVIAGLFLAWVVGYADRILMSVALVPISHEFALSAREAGMLLSAFYFSYAIMQLAGGWLSDRYGSRIVVVVCIVMWSIFTGATSLAWSFASLLVIRFMFGIGEGSFSPASSVTVAEVFPKKQRARAKSFLVSTTFLGSAAGSAIIATSVNKLGWRGAFEILSVVGVAVAVILWVSLRSGIGAQKEANADRPRIIWRSVLRSPLAWKLTAVWFFTSALHVGVQSWMPTYLMTNYHISLKQAGFALVVPNLLAFIGANAVGFLLDKLDRRFEKGCLVVGSALSTVFLVLMITTTQVWLLITYWTLFSLSFNLVYATVFATPLRRVPEHLIGSTSGLMNFGGQMANSIFPVTMGALITASGGAFFSAFYLLIAVGVLSIVASLMFKVPNDNSSFSVSEELVRKAH
ncbi:MFS transporter [Paraburkholderia sp. Ac-20336]|uniref:MFS transporter n=1 Tax=unclassified Paraburkholderia TaxID=2615204 RepID=UPI00197F9D01|nr:MULTISPECIES: MFS transporter [unclassified Paraburkholderia]MBN3804370.1 MFS transporter [Paraburkholderia sp. Ac-20336]MBN3851374.1 MFS transporter [Paraburkholderia sp. Ac-20342]